MRLNVSSTPHGMSATRIYAKTYKYQWSRKKSADTQKDTKKRMATHPNQPAAEMSKSCIKKRPKSKHPTDLAKEIRLGKLEDGNPLGIAIHMLFSNKVKKIYQMSSWINSKA